MHFVKIWDTILRSSVWDESPDVRVMWLTFLCLADQDGFVEGVESSMARAANLPRPQAREAIRVLEAPDLESKSQEYAGRRIEKVEGGWMVLNYQRYRDLQTAEQARDAARKRRERADKADVSGTSADPTSTSASPSASGGVVRSSAREDLPELAREAYDAIAGDRPASLDGLLRSLTGGMGGRAYTWEQVGRALLDYHANETGKFSAVHFRRYVERVALPARPAGANGQQARNHAALQRFAESGGADGE